MKKLLLILFTAVLFSSFINALDTRPSKKFYTVQAATFYKKDCKKAHDLYVELKKTRGMVYYIKDKDKQRDCVRIRIGVFGSDEEAKEEAKKLRLETKLKAIVVETTGITISDYKGKFDMINTPSGIWMWDYKVFKEVKNFGADFHCETLTMENPVSISPDGKEIVYLFDGKITKINLLSGKESDLLKPQDAKVKLERSSPKWSPDGKYVAFLDVMNAKVGTCLRVVKADGTNEHCVIDNDNKKRAVMSFEWAADKNKIYYVEGVSTMRVPIGGELFVTDINGKSKLLIQPEKDSVVYHDFEIEGNKINYVLAVFKGKSRDEYTLSDRVMNIK